MSSITALCILFIYHSSHKTPVKSHLSAVHSQMAFSATKLSASRATAQLWVEGKLLWDYGSIPDHAQHYTALEIMKSYSLL